MDSKYLRLPSYFRFPSSTSDRKLQVVISNHFLAVGTSYSTLGVTGDNTFESSTIKQQYSDLHSQIRQRDGFDAVNYSDDLVCIKKCDLSWMI